VRLQLEFGISLQSRRELFGDKRSEGHGGGERAIRLSAVKQREHPIASYVDIRGIELVEEANRCIREELIRSGRLPIVCSRTEAGGVRHIDEDADDVRNPKPVALVVERNVVRVRDAVSYLNRPALVVDVDLLLANRAEPLRELCLGQCHYSLPCPEPPDSLS
jgi:hypothetical protein